MSCKITKLYNNWQVKYTMNKILVNLVDSSMNLWTTKKIFIIVCKSKCTSPHNNKFVSILTKSSVNRWWNIVSSVVITFAYKKGNGTRLHCVRMYKMENWDITFIEIIMKYTFVPEHCKWNIGKD